MTVTDILAWIAGIGSLLYFGAAMVNPAWFLGDEVEPPAPTTPEGNAIWINFPEQDDWQQLGQSH